MVIHRFIGVPDLASVRFSLPSQLLEPTPNLEYWNYIDAPNAFIAIGTADEPVDRMLEVLRFWFTKDLKYAKGKPCKPYNSCLGEFFRVRHSGPGTCLYTSTAVLLLIMSCSVTGRRRTMRLGLIPRLSRRPVPLEVALLASNRPNSTSPDWGQATREVPRLFPFRRWWPSRRSQCVSRT